MDKLIIAILFVFTLILFGCFWLDDTACHWQWDNSGRPVQWSFGTGCQIKDDKGWIPAENFRAF